MKKIISIILALSFVFSLCICADAEDNALRFDENGNFRILQISDPQDDHYPAYDLVNFIKLAIDEFDPDLIVMTGDIVEDSRAGDLGIDGESFREGVEVNGDYNQTFMNVKKTCEAVFSEAESRGIPFAITQGNNDYGSGVTNEDWLKIYSEYEYCLTADMSNDADGRIDYNLEILGSDGKPAFNLWMMDNGRGISAEQIAWYESESTKLTEANGGKPVPAIVFEHIPVDDMGNLFEECNFWDEGAVLEGGKCYRLIDGLADGYYAGAIAPGQSSEQFASWKKQGDVIGAYFGHWHTTGWTGVYDGIELGFTYGCEFAKPGPYGVRVFDINENDVENFGSKLYTYEGSVKKGNARFELQTDEPYKVYSNPIEEFFGAIRNIFELLSREIKQLLS